MTTPTRGFPLELLNKSDAERTDYFLNYISRHPRLHEVDRALWRATHTRIRDTIIFVFGPPGVGKTTLMEGIERRLTLEAAKNLAFTENKHCVAVLSLEAPAFEKGDFNWKDFYTRSLVRLEQPFIDEIVKDSSQRLIRRMKDILSFPSRTSGDEYRLALEHSLRYRKPVTFLIDDAQHIGKISYGRRLQDQLDVIKSLNIKSETLITLIGTYELIPLRNLSGQLSRRSIDIHFPRYGTTEQDIVAFRNILFIFQKHLPLPVEPDLQKHWEFCYVHSIGCIGILKDWLTRSLEDALSEKAKTINLEILKRNALTSDQCENIAAEALEGEAMLSQRGKTTTRLMEMLGFTKVSSRSGKSGISLQEEISKNKTKKKPRLPRPAGLRNATRDKVG